MLTSGAFAFWLPIVFSSIMGSLNLGRLCGSCLKAVCVEEPGFPTGSVFGAHLPWVP